MVAEDVGWQLPKAQLFKWLEYRIWHPAVVEFHESQARMKITSAPARTSKSVSAAKEGAYHFFPQFQINPKGGLMKQPGGSHKPVPLSSKLLWCVGPDYTTNKEFAYIFEDLVDNRGRFGFDYTIERAQNRPKNGDMQIIVNWGKDPRGNVCRSVCEAKTAERPKVLQGEEIDWAVMSEAAELDSEIYTKYLSTRVHHLCLPTTPKPKADWIKNLIDQSGDKSKSIDHFHYNIVWDKDPDKRLCANPKFDWERFEIAMKLAASLSPSGRAEDWPHFAEQFLGLWVYYTGVVLPFRWSKPLDGRMSHVIDRMPPNHEFMKSFVSVDYGYDHDAAALFWKVFPDGTLVIFAEVVEAKLNPTQFIDKIMQKCEEENVDPDYFVGDPSRPEVASMMQDLGLPIYNHGSKNELRDRASGALKLIEYMADDESLMRGDGEMGRPKLFLLRSGCRQTIEQWKVLRRKENFTGDEFSKGAFAPQCKDDTFDAARYGIQSRATPYSEPTERNWMHEHMQRYRQHQRANPPMQPAMRGMVGRMMES